MEKRFPINFRAFLVVAAAVVAAVFCVYFYMLNRAVGIALGCVLLCGLCALFVIFLLRFSGGKTKLRVVIALGMATAFSLCAFIVGTASFDKRKSGAEKAGYNTVTGRVCAIDTRSGEYRIELDDLVIGGKCADGNMLVTLEASDSDVAELLDYGYRLTFYANVTHRRLLYGYYVNGYEYRANIGYSATVGTGDMRIQAGEPLPLEAFLSSVHSLMVENMGDRYGNIAFSMLTGDKRSLFTGVSEAYSVTGLGHILAVSGLHVGFLIMVLSFILSKLDRRVKTPIILAVVMAYVTIADFSPSVVRAAIMAAISYSALFSGGRRDMFSSLLCAFSGILAVKPLYLFDAGFLLSFGAILGIAMFANMIKQSLVRKNVNGKIGDSLGASVSVACGILPPQLYFFGQFPIISVVANIVLLPFISVVFTVTLCSLPIAAIPGCGKLLLASKYLFIGLDYMVYGLSLVPFASAAVKTGATVFLCYPVMFCASDFFMIKRGKSVVVLYSVVVCAVIIALSAL